MAGINLADFDSDYDSEDDAPHRIPRDCPGCTGLAWSLYYKLEINIIIKMDGVSLSGTRPRVVLTLLGLSDASITCAIRRRYHQERRCQPVPYFLAWIEVTMVASLVSSARAALNVG